MASETSYVVAYHDTRCLGEPVRLLLAIIEYRDHISWEDKRYRCGPPPDYDKTAWATDKRNLGLPFANLPYLEVKATGETICQTRAILRFLGRRHGLAPSTDPEATYADVISEAAADLWGTFCDTTYCSFPKEQFPECHVDGSQCRETERFLEIRKQYISQLPRKLQPFEDAIPADTFLAGDLSYADCFLFEALDELQVFAPGCLKNFPNLSRFSKRFSDLPEVVAYRNSTRFKAEPFHSPYSHFHEGWIKRSFPDEETPARPSSSEDAATPCQRFVCRRLR